MPTTFVPASGQFELGPSVKRAAGPLPRLTRLFTAGASSVKEMFTWEKRTAEIKGADGKVVFRAENVEVPSFWSQTATDIVAEKYLRAVRQPDGTLKRETSAWEMATRVAGTIARWGRMLGYFASDDDAKVFVDELVWLTLSQSASFNSPVWFNVGTTGEAIHAEQASACFILSVDDTMSSILELSRTEGILYKGGSGSGVNYSRLRSSREKLSGGGTASGPVPFIAKDDANGGAIKSGGGTRRAAKMAVLDADHGDIVEFIECKAKSEKMAHALVDAGFDSDFRARFGAYQSVPFQNANHSVRVTDEFMQAVVEDRDWNLLKRPDGNRSTQTVPGGSRVLETIKARDLWKRICDAAWVCGDPGLQFDTTINRMHTIPAHGRINGSNPCCVSAETLVDTAEGKIRIDALAGMSTTGDELPHVFAWDLDANLPVLRKIKRAWLAGETTSIVEVVTDKGIRIKCTPDHRFLLRDGSWVEAQDLEPGDRLRKISRGINKNRGARRQIYHRIAQDDGRGPYNTVWQNRFMWEQVHGAIPDGMEVHHRDGDPTNDRLSNFELVPVSTHRAEHARGATNPNALEVTPEALVEAWEAIERARGSVTIWRWNKYIRDNNLQGKLPQAQSPSIGGRVHGMGWADFTTWIDEHRVDANDRVLSVTRVHLDAPMKVYDLEVDGVHNFAVGDALHTIVIHNSEYMSIDDSACNLASLNLRKFQRPDGTFDVATFEHAVDVMITAMDIIVDGAAYPIEKVGANARRHRQLGLGYANLGAYLMSRGMAYDSDEGRKEAALITALMCGRAYRRSAELAAHVGPFEGFDMNRGAMLSVIQAHRDALDKYTGELQTAAELAWADALSFGKQYGFRNSQATVLAPTGTIAFMMDCDTTGIEPDLALTKTKKLVGGGTLKIVNQSVSDALRALHYSETDISLLTAYAEKHGSLVGSGISASHLAIFDTSLEEKFEKRTIAAAAHVRMMGAVQPFISGAISKTVNMPESTTADDISEIYMLAWREGLKAVAIYRDGAKRTQPLSAGEAKTIQAPAAAPTPVRRKLPDTRHATTHKFRVGDHKGYMTVGLFEDGKPGELFIKMNKEGSTVSGLMDTIATLTSMALQYGVPLEALVEKFQHVAFEPSGWTNSPLGRASSVVDYVFRWMGSKWDPSKRAVADEVKAVEKIETMTVTATGSVSVKLTNSGTICSRCGHTMVRTGACHTCPTCGLNSGCG